MLKRSAAIAAHFLMSNFLFLVLAFAAWENGHLGEAIAEPIMIGALALGTMLFAVTMLVNRSPAAEH